MLEYLSTLRVSCIERGDFEGLLITGIGGKVGGKELLQRCVDVTHDIQTTALLVCRTLITADEVVAGRGGSKVGKTPDKLTVEDRDSIWLYEYRQLLNRWEMFMERAALDVALGMFFIDPYLMSLSVILFSNIFQEVEYSFCF